MNAPSCLCPDTVPDWHNKDIDLSGKATHTLPMPTLFHMPMSYDTYVQQQQTDIEQLELQEEWPGLVLTKTGFFKGALIRVLLSGDSPSRFIQYLDNDFKLRGFLHPGDIGTVKDSTRELQNTIFDLGRMPKELYLCYLTCPVCSESKGGDKILLLRRWKESPTLAKRIKK
ncbi:hydrolase [Kaarinaea lacus]